jgi:hypothetical protein
VQVDPIKPKSNPPGTKRLNLEYDKLLSTLAFKFNLRRCSEVVTEEGLALMRIMAGAYARSQFSST